MSKFLDAYNNLNVNQRRAVNLTDGPLLVIAGPGTGKTSLLATRVANILTEQSISPGNILCLTFTDNAARNMLDRLVALIGQPAYHVAIHTFHSFGSDIINQFPEYFIKRALLQPIDDLGAYELLIDIFNDLHHSNPLSSKAGDEFIFIKEAQNIIGWLKHNAVSPDDFQVILKSNEKFFTEATTLIQSVPLSPPSPKHLLLYKKLIKDLQSKNKQHGVKNIESYCDALVTDLEKAVNLTSESSRHAPALTKWRTKWLEKDPSNQYVFKDHGKRLEKQYALQEVYKNFQERLAINGFYDFNDMVMESVSAIESNADLRYNLQERYQYILVDEFQDTNKAQLRMLQALGSNPIFEGRPNIMAVGDPNQTIYAFQGAEASNTNLFKDSFRDVQIIKLIDNYRSTQNILDVSTALLEQQDENQDMLHLKANLTLETNALEHNAFSSELAQYQWISEKINHLISQGVRPNQIGVLGPKHKYLERLMPYLAKHKVPVAYERRENILDAPIIFQLLRMAELIDSLSKANYTEVDSILFEVLSYPFWELPSYDLIKLSLDCYKSKDHWIPIALKSKNENIINIVNWFIDTARISKSEPLEHILDILSGNSIINKSKTAKKRLFTSPYKNFYFEESILESNAQDYLTHLGQLSTLRHHLRSWKPNQLLRVEDLIEFVNLHRKANIKIVDNNPHSQSTNAVQVMTVHKAKGLEFDVVFVINAQEEVWGATSKNRGDMIKLPSNLPVKPAGSTNDDKVRLFFVALTRAMHSLYITSYTHRMDGKLSLGLGFIGGNKPEQKPIHSLLKANHISAGPKLDSIETLSTDWAFRYSQIIADKPSLFEPILNNYRLSITHLNNFLNVVRGGPQYFLLHNLLRFPEAISPSAAYGDAIHKSIQWYYAQLKNSGKVPSVKHTQTFFIDALMRKHLAKSDFIRLKNKGESSLKSYLKLNSKNFLPSHIIERGFSREGVVIEEARLTGKIDKMIDKGAGLLSVVDLKTGKISRSWQGKDETEKQKLHHYKNQLLFYKLLVENSASYKSYKRVDSGYIEFVETDVDPRSTLTILELQLDQPDIDRMRMLIKAVWQHIHTLNFPDISQYPKTLKGILQFEEDLINPKQ